MNNNIRRKDRRIDDRESALILQNGEYGVLSMSTPDNEGYGIPMSYVFSNGRIYFHCATEGSKLDYLKINNKVSFCVVGKTEILPSKFGTIYESCIVYGAASIADGDEKKDALMLLVEKYSGEYINEGAEYIDKLLEKVLVIKLEIESMRGKARKQ